MAGHFTQVVWKTSLKLGIGRAEGQVNGDKCIFSVARYRDAGNYGGKFEENVKQGFSILSPLTENFFNNYNIFSSLLDLQNTFIQYD